MKRSAALVVLWFTATALSACGGAQARKAKHMEKGESYLASGNLDKARVEFQNALQIAPTDPEARYENGLVLEKLGKIKEAAQFYQGVIDVKPDHAGARTHLARLYIFSALPDKAMELITPALEAHPDDAELLTLRAAARVQLKDIPGGRADAERAVELAPDNPDSVATLAGIYSSTKDYGKAQTLLEAAAKRNPSNVDLRLALAQVYGSEGRTADVERTLLELVRLQPEERAQRVRLAQFYAGQNQLDAAEAALRDGIKALPGDRGLKMALIDFLNARRSPETAEKELSAMIAADPKDFDLKFALAKFYESNGQPARAEGVYQQVIDSEQLNAPGLAARDRLAALHVARNDLPGAKKLVAEVLAASPRDDEALVMRGNFYLLEKDAKAAIADLRTVLRDQPNATGVLRTLARAHMANGEPAIAEETMRRAVDASPKDAGLRLDLAQLLTQMGKPEQAKSIAAEVVKEQPDNVAALDLLFRTSAATKDSAAARGAADALVATQPKGAMGYLYQGMLAEADKHVDEALRSYARATDLQPDALEPLEAEVRLLLSLKRTAVAEKRLDDIAARAPTAPFAPNLKGELLFAENDLPGAQAQYKIAMQRAPTWWLPYHNLAQAQFAAKDPDGALATLHTAQKVTGAPERIGVDIAYFDERSGKFDDAIREYENVLRSAPQSEVAANNLAMALVTYKRDAASLDRAKALTARFADSSNPNYLDTYGWVLFKHGEAAASVSVLERVVSKAPDAPVALYHLGMAQSQAGSTAQALGNLTKAVNSGAKFSGLDEARAALERLAKLPTDSAAKT